MLQLGSDHERMERTFPDVGFIAISVLVAASLIYVLNSSSDLMRWVTLGLLGIAILSWAVRATIADPKWLVLALLLIETLPYVNVIPVDAGTQGRWFFRIPLLFAFAIPALAAQIWKSRKNGRDESAGWTPSSSARTGHAVQKDWLGGLERSVDIRLLGIFYLWGAVTILYSLDQGISAGRLIGDFVALAVLAVIAANVKSEKDVQEVVRRFLIGCTMLQGLILIAFLFFPRDLAWMPDELSSGVVRFTGPFSAPNDVGEVMLATVAAALIHWRACSGRSRWWLAGLIAVALIFGAVADSRSPFVALALGVVLYLVWRNGVRGLMVVTAAALLAVGIYQSASDSTRSYFNRDIGTVSGRTEAWDFELRKIKASPLFGYGYSVEGEIFNDRYFTSWEIAWSHGVNTPLHNGYFSVAAGMGIPALIFWLFVFLKPWLRVFQSADDPWHLKTIFFMIMVPTLAIGAVESPLADPRYSRGVLQFVCWLIVERALVLQSAKQIIVLGPLSRVSAAR